MTMCTVVEQYKHQDTRGNRCAKIGYKTIVGLLLDATTAEVGGQ
jgi:hypothetical protein